MSYKQSTTVITSPSKPKVVTIPRRRTATTPPSSSSSGIEKDYSVTSYQTTPVSSVGLGIDKIRFSDREKEKIVYNNIKARACWTTSTTPSTPFSSPTIRPIPRPSTSRPLQYTLPHLSELTTWILTKLERLVASSSELTLDKLVIQQIRLPPSQRRVPQTHPLCR